MKRYTDDFKRDAVQYLDEHPDMTRAQVAQYLGIPKDTLYGWTKTASRNKLFGTNDPVPAHASLPSILLVSFLKVPEKANRLDEALPGHTSPCITFV